MSIPLKTGIVVATIAIKKLCHTLTTYRPVINQVIAAAVSAELITTIQAGILNTWLDGAQTACDIIRTVSGY